MSSQFSYELDERHIRLTMQDAELDYNDALWNKFDSLHTVESKSSLIIGRMIPSFNMSISRSVIVPVLFVFLIGGLSAILFSFIDFKKKVSIDSEIPLLANPDNIHKAVKISEKTVKPISKTQIAKATLDTSIKVIPTPSVLSNKSTSTLVIENKKEDTIKLTKDNPKEEIISTNNIKKETSQRVEKRKKTRKVRSEILPVINAATNLNEGVSEPELELK
ncbi:MAG: hypothetical protein H7141_13560 [Burkholderiales bacterium]|nr:hypothetical protein [Bacteroidia bacterium]